MRRLLLSVLFAALWMPVLGIAQTAEKPPAAPASAVIAPPKLAWINLEQAVVTCDEGKRQFEEIQKFMEAKTAEMEAMRKEFESLRNQLNVQSSKLTDEARSDLEGQVEAKDTALQRFQQDTQKDIENRQKRAGNYIAKKVQTVAERVAKEKGFSAVLVINSSRDLYIDPSLNITEEIIKSYNQAYPVSAPKAPPAAAPAPAKKP